MYFEQCIIASFTLAYNENKTETYLKTSHYILYSLGVIVMLAAGIALSYTPVKSIVRSIRDSVHREPGYEEI